MTWRSILALLLYSATIQAGELTLEDIFQNKTYAVDQFHFDRWVKKGTAYLDSEEQADGNLLIWLYDIQTGEKTLFLDTATLPAPFASGEQTCDSYSLSPDERYMLIGAAEEKVWRRSTRSFYYVYDLQEEQLYELGDGQNKQQVPAVSPDSRKVAYVMNNDLFAYDMVSGKTRHLTKDGNWRISNGHADWLYEEEFSITQTYQWSPDSKSILFLRFHQWPGQDEPKTYPLVDEMPLYPEVFHLPYPKVGERNSVVSLGVVNVDRGKTKWFDLGDNEDIYVPRIYWTGQADEIAFLQLDRRQQNLAIFRGSIKTMETIRWVHQSDEAWVDITDDLFFINAGQQAIWTSEESGYRHIYLLEGNDSRQITRGDWEVSQVIGVNESTDDIFFTGNGAGSPHNAFYKVAMPDGEIQALSPEKGWIEIDISPTQGHYFAKHSAINSPPVTGIYRSDGTLTRELLTHESLSETAKTLPQWQFFQLPTSDGEKLSGKILYPPGFSTNRRYATVIYTYGGPGSQKVRNQWGESRGRDMWHRYMAQQGFVILTVDNRGTGGRGKAFRNLAYGDLGKWSLNDQVEAAKWVGQQSWGDKERIGIWGWSGGGYLTALCLTAGAEHFTSGVAVAPVTDFRLYDTAWTERYMGLVTENEAGYDAASVLSYVDSYRGNLLLVHGTGDDNVHPQNTWQLIDKLVKANKTFELMMYPNKDHGLPDVHYHLYSKMTAFLTGTLHP